MSNTVAIVLAGGRSSRMGQERHKLLLPLGDRPVLFHVLDTVLASQVQALILVLGYQADNVRLLLPPHEARLVVVYNPDFQQGMSTSLRKGVETVQSLYPDAGSAMIVLGDQPLMTTHILDSLIALKQTTGKRIIVTRYQGKRGSPTLFDASLFPELLTMAGDEGGRKVIEQHKEEVAALPIDDASPSLDVDTWEAYMEVVDLWNKRQ